MKDNQKKQTGNVNVFYTLAGIYLLYLAYKLARGLLDGTGGSPVLAVIGLVAFTIIGGGLCWRSWQAYKFALEHKDDPETWSDEPWEPEALETPEEAAGIEADLDEDADLDMEGEEEQA